MAYFSSQSPQESKTAQYEIGKKPENNAMYHTFLFPQYHIQTNIFFSAVPETVCQQIDVIYEAIIEAFIPCVYRALRLHLPMTYTKLERKS